MHITITFLNQHNVLILCVGAVTTSTATRTGYPTSTRTLIIAFLQKHTVFYKFNKTIPVRLRRDTGKGWFNYQRKVAHSFDCQFSLFSGVPLLQNINDTNVVRRIFSPAVQTTFVTLMVPTSATTISSTSLSQALLEKRDKRTTTAGVWVILLLMLLLFMHRRLVVVLNVATDTQQQTVIHDVALFQQRRVHFQLLQ